MSRKRKKWLSRMLALCLILALLPINTAYADEVDTQDATYRTKRVDRKYCVLLKIKGLQAFNLP